MYFLIEKRRCLKGVQVEDGKRDGRGMSRQTSVVSATRSSLLPDQPDTKEAKESLPC